MYHYSTFQELSLTFFETISPDLYNVLKVINYMYSNQ